MGFLTELLAIQKKEHLTDKKCFTDEEMATKIGCSRQLYQMTRTEKIPVGFKILEGAVRAFPELQRSAIYFLMHGANKTTETADQHVTPCQTSHNRRHGVFGYFQGLWDSVSKFLGRKARRD